MIKIKDYLVSYFRCTMILSETSNIYCGLLNHNGYRYLVISLTVHYTCTSGSGELIQPNDEEHYIFKRRCFLIEVGNKRNLDWQILLFEECLRILSKLVKNHGSLNSLWSRRKTLKNNIRPNQLFVHIHKKS